MFGSEIAHRCEKCLVEKWSRGEWSSQLSQCVIPGGDDDDDDDDEDHEEEEEEDEAKDRVDYGADDDGEGKRTHEIWIDIL